MVLLPASHDALRTPPPGRDLSEQDAALLDLLHWLSSQNYGFATPAPNTHRRILLRRGGVGASLEDLFGWNLPVEMAGLGRNLLELMERADILRRRGSRVSSRLRVASVGDQLFLHSAFPVSGKQHVFFGPDSYRFAQFLQADDGPWPPGCVIADIGAGAGVGGLTAAVRAANPRLLLTDVNPQALRLARINAAFAGFTVTTRLCDGLPFEEGKFDLIVANPPYIQGSGLTYSDGGGALGGEITLRWAVTGLERLAPGGRLLLYSGSAIVRGHDELRRGLGEAAAEAGCSFDYRVLDPDVFPATLLQPGYWGVERIAAFGATFARPGA